MPVRVAPGRWPLLGHTPALPRRRFGFTEGLRVHGDLVRVYLDSMRLYFVTTPELVHRVLVTESAKFEKGAMFDKFRPFFGNGRINSGSSYHLRQRGLIQQAFHHDPSSFAQPTRFDPDRPLKVAHISTAYPTQLSMAAVSR